MIWEISEHMSDGLPGDFSEGSDLRGLELRRAERATEFFSDHFERVEIELRELFGVVILITADLNADEFDDASRVEELSEGVDGEGGIETVSREGVDVDFERVPDFIGGIERVGPLHEAIHVVDPFFRNAIDGGGVATIAPLGFVDEIATAVFGAFKVVGVGGPIGETEPAEVVVTRIASHHKTTVILLYRHLTLGTWLCILHHPLDRRYILRILLLPHLICLACNRRMGFLTTIKTKQISTTTLSYRIRPLIYLLRYRLATIRRWAPLELSRTLDKRLGQKLRILFPHRL